MSTANREAMKSTTSVEGSSSSTDLLGCRESFEDFASGLGDGLCLDEVWNDVENPYINDDTHLAYKIWLASWIAAKAT